MNKIKAQLETMNQQIKELTHLYHDRAIRSNISENEFWVWYTLIIYSGDYSQQDICSILSLPKQTVNSIVSNLVKKNYAYLETDTNARNHKLVRLTENGAEIGKAIVSDAYSSEEKAFSRLDEHERDAFISLLKKYAALLDDEFSRNSEVQE